MYAFIRPLGTGDTIGRTPMNQIIVYGSEYGTTKRYAEKLSQASGIDAIEYEDVKTLQNYGRIIYLGGLYAGGVKGLKRTAKFIPPKAQLLLVTVGLADVTDPENIRNIRQSVSKQVPADILQNTVLFHLRGGIDYSKLSVLHKTMMTLLYTKAKRLPDEKKTAEVRAMIETYNTKVDFVDFNTLAPILEQIR